MCIKSGICCFKTKWIEKQCLELENRITKYFEHWKNVTNQKFEEIETQMKKLRETEREDSKKDVYYFLFEKIQQYLRMKMFNCNQKSMCEARDI